MRLIRLLFLHVTRYYPSLPLAVSTFDVAPLHVYRRGESPDIAPSDSATLSIIVVAVQVGRPFVLPIDFLDFQDPGLGAFRTSDPFTYV